MSQKINLKSIIIIILAMIIGVYVIFIQDQIITGLVIIVGGISLNFLEVAKWVKEFMSFLKSFNKDEPEPEKEKPSNQTNIVNIGDGANFHGDTALQCH